METLHWLLFGEASAYDVAAAAALERCRKITDTHVSELQTEFDRATGDYRKNLATTIARLRPRDAWTTNTALPYLTGRRRPGPDPDTPPAMPWSGQVRASR